MHKLFKYFSYSLFFFTIFFIFIFFNIGKFLDISEEPKESDIIVCLGGGDKKRVEKSIELYKQGYSKSNLLVFTGDNRSARNKEKNMPDNRIEYLEDNGYKDIKTFLKLETKNTKEEVLFIKQFLLEKNIKSAIIVSDAPHTRRINALIYLLDIKGDENFSFNLVSTDADWWNKDTYYTNKRAYVFVVFESIKLVYTYLTYGLFEKLGILSFIEDNNFIHDIKKFIIKETYSYLK